MLGLTLIVLAGTVWVTGRCFKSCAAVVFGRTSEVKTAFSVSTINAEVVRRRVEHAKARLVLNIRINKVAIQHLAKEHYGELPFSDSQRVFLTQADGGAWDMNLLSRPQYRNAFGGFGRFIIWFARQGIYVFNEPKPGYAGIDTTRTFPSITNVKLDFKKKEPVRVFADRSAYYGPDQYPRALQLNERRLGGVGLPLYCFKRIAGNTPSPYSGRDNSPIRQINLPQPIQKPRTARLIWRVGRFVIGCVCLVCERLFAQSRERLSRWCLICGFLLLLSPGW